MNEVLTAWGQFAAALVLIGYAGTVLSRYGDVIAQKTGLGGTWIGVALVAVVTSFPELVTGISAVSLADDADIAVGTVLGSCVFNMGILVVLDFLSRGRSVFQLAGREHILSAGLGVILIGVVGFNVLLATRDGSSAPALGIVGVYTPIILLLYAVSVRVVFRYERENPPDAPASEFSQATSLSSAVAAFSASAVVVIAVSLSLPFVAQNLAAAMDWHRTFVGTLFVAAVTSLPEVVVTVAALRIGAVDLAVGNLFGSNMFNIVVIAVDDFFYLDGPILSAVDPVHVLSAFSALMMTGVAIVGLLYRPRGRIFGGIGWASLILVTIYLLNSYVLYLFGG
jgi:cation:H+ antiporter